MKRIALDIETNLAHTQIWLACCKDVDTGEVTCHREPASLRSVVADADLIYAHNGVFFDLEMLNQHWSMGIPLNRCVDTLVQSRLLKPQLNGGHSLEAWGERLRMPKGEFSDFDGGWSPEMQKYCIQDVQVLDKLRIHLANGLANAKFSQKSQDLEHQVAIIIAQQIRTGIGFNEQACLAMQSRLELELSDVQAQLLIVFRPTEVVMKTKTKYIDFNPGSRVQIGKRLMALGWVPTEFTETGRPVVDENTLAGSHIDEVKLIQRYLTLEKVIGQMAQWLKYCKDGRIHGNVITNGAITSRMSHSQPNLGQIPNSQHPFGPECRDLFWAADGRLMVGADAKGLELRMLAHYMNDPKYTEMVCSGDVHTANMNAAGLPTRDMAKTFIYGYLYGAGDAKIGKIVDGTAQTGKKLKKQFLANTPALSALKDKLKSYVAKGYVPGLDGRKIWIRHEHAALNTLLQGAGAVVMKQALVFADAGFRKHGLATRFVANVHDEFQTEALPDEAEISGQIMVQSIRDAGEELNMRCPLDGDFKVGATWKHTH